MPQSIAVAPPEPPSAPRPARRERDISLRRLVESAVLFGIIVLILRSLAVEPFGVPTGSMAMTMVGNHKTCVCPRCGYPVVVGGGSGGKADAGAAERAYATAWCPNCYQTDLHLEQVRETVGDRLLVDKNIFELRGPRRWEVAVFRNPSDMSKPYVKRVVGLPGDAVQIRGGDVFIDGRLSRKTLEQCRALRVLVFDNAYQPKEGWSSRWRKGSPDNLPPDLTRDKSLAPADEQLEGTALKWSPSNPAGDFSWLVYRHWLLDERREEPIRDVFAYNGSALRHELHEVHDFLVEFEVEVGSGSGAFALTLYDGQNHVTVEIPVVAAGAASEGARLRGVDDMSAPVPRLYLKEGHKYRIEFAFVDRRVMLAVDGKEAFAPVDLPFAAERAGVSRPLWLGAKGSAVTIRDFRLFRDVHYTPGGRNGIHDPWPLGPDEYFMLGDNSANSEDSRFWSRPGVPAANFLGKPLLLHQPSRWSALGSWELQCLDWHRIRWIR